ncbi:MAG: HEAT repeat domain-containing protein, partial [Bryobacterales bacterium]
IGAGSVAGAIAGSVIARILANLTDARALLLASVVVLLITAGASLTFLPRPNEAEAESRKRRRGGAALPMSIPMMREEQASRSMFRSLSLAWRRPFLRRVGALVLVSTLTLTFVDYLFKSRVAAAIPAADLGSFFSGTYLVLNLVSLAAQVFLVRRLMRAIPVNRVLSVLPGLLVLGGIAAVATGGLISALALKLFDGGLRHSLHRTATEVLFVPLPGDLRSRVKGVIDVAGQRGGQAVASLVILTAVALHGERWVIGLAIMALGLVWLYLAKTLQRHYVNLFRETLMESNVQPRMDFPELDLASLESLIEALNSPNDREVLAALDLLAEQDRTRLIPALLLYHPAPVVVIRTLELFTSAGRSDVLPLLERLYERSEPSVRAAALRATSWFAPSVDAFERFVEDPACEVRAAALVGLVSYQGSTSALETIHRMAELHNEDETGVALASAIRCSPGAVFSPVLVELARSGSPSVKREIARTMREVLSASFIPPLIDMLAVREARAEARRTLVAIGPDALDALRRLMENPWSNPQVRQHVPRTLVHFGSQIALDVLQARLLDEPDGVVRYKALRAIGSMNADHPELALDRAVLDAVAERTLRNAYRVLEWRVQLEDGVRAEPARVTPVYELIHALLLHKFALGRERLFRVLGLLHPKEDLRSIYRGLHSGRRDVRASSRELLEHVLIPPLREPILNLVDEVDDAAKIRSGQPYHRYQPRTYVDVLRELLKTGGTGSRSLVSYHVAELGLTVLRPVLQTLPSDRDGFVAQSVERALEALGPEPLLPLGAES